MNVTLLKKQFTTGGAALYFFAAFGGTSLAQTADTNLLTGATNVTRLPDVIVTGRQDSLLGIADSASARHHRRGATCRPPDSAQRGNS